MLQLTLNVLYSMCFIGWRWKCLSGACCSFVISSYSMPSLQVLLGFRAAWQDMTADPLPRRIWFSIVKVCLSEGYPPTLSSISPCSFLIPGLHSELITFLSRCQGNLLMRLLTDKSAWTAAKPAGVCTVNNKRGLKDFMNQFKAHLSSSCINW